MAAHVKGFDVVMRNLNAEIKAMKVRAMKGLIEATIIIRRGTETQEPKIPVDTGNLRNSWFTTTNSFQGSPYVSFGYTANYAVFVHEMVDKGGKGQIDWTRKGSGPKFFSSSIVDNRDEILKAIQQNSSIKR